MNETPAGQLKAQIESLTQLKDSSGWQLIVTALNDSILNAALSLSRNADLAETPIHFTRGAIFAADDFSRLPETLIGKMETELLLRQPPEANNEE